MSEHVPAGENPRPALTYAASGVDIDAGDRAVEAIKDLVKSTYRPGVLSDLGGFGGLFKVPAGYRQPVLVATTDGVGTKLAVARDLGRFDTVGIDLVAMCVDDLVCMGAEPLFFLDYQAHGSLDPDVVAELMTGIAAGCRQAGCAILGGELAAHPGTLAPGDVDLVGFAVGIVDADRVLDGSAVRPSDALIGLASPGLRSNGYSLARQALLVEAGRRLDWPAWEGAERSLGDELLEPSVIYAPAVRALMAAVEVHAAAHVTGGGLPGNLPRVLPEGNAAIVSRGTWPVPTIFGEIQRAGRITDEEMNRVFNLGIGMVVVVPSADADRAVQILAGAGVAATVIGKVINGPRSVLYSG
ncbi:MAG: phosphoribosylformylglycinamidine cyclo-ligase [Actinomycetota bacterium]|nr:phosphoribosylformylglycinamidine cyclo-ligase [Actinomycetota bacterium]